MLVVVAAVIVVDQLTWFSWDTLGYNILDEQSARAAAGGEDRTSLPGLRPQAVHRWHPPHHGDRSSTCVGQLSLGRELRRAVAHEADRGRGRLLNIQGPHSLDQRRTHGGLLPGGRPGDQARDLGGGAFIHTARRV